MDKPYSQAAENNKKPILETLKQCFAEASRVLEIGSGTGQHAEYFAAALPHLQWQPSDMPAQMAGLNLCLEKTMLSNLLVPMTLNVQDNNWPAQKFDGVFTANTLHIMPWTAVPCLFRGIGRVLLPGGKLCIYGPFKYQGDFTTPSNANFDHWLKSQWPHQGIRDFEAVNALAMEQGLSFIQDRNMPANNQLLSWEKT